MNDTINEPFPFYNKKDRWEQLESLIAEFHRLGMGQTVNFDAFNRIAIVHHSSAIEGSTLTHEETALLITEGTTAKGKSMNEHRMVEDHHTALMYTLAEANVKTHVTPALLQSINAKVNKNTGQVRNLATGICDDTKGDFRLGNVTAGGSYFVNYDKVPGLVSDLCKLLQEKMKTAKTIREIYELSFDAHFNLVSIHPWFDGNGRTSRLLMNFIQQYHGLPLSIVFLEDKPAYFKALTDAREKSDADVFRNFLCEQQIIFLKKEINHFLNAGKGFTFLF